MRGRFVGEGAISTVPSVIHARRVVRGITRRIRRLRQRLGRVELVLAAERATASGDWPLAAERWRAVAVAGGRRLELRAAAPTSTALRMQGQVEEAARLIAAAERMRGVRADVAIAIAFERAAIELMRRDGEAALSALQRLRLKLPQGHELERSVLVMRASASRMVGASTRSFYWPEELHARQLAELTSDDMDRMMQPDQAPTGAPDEIRENLDAVDVSATVVTLVVLAEPAASSEAIDRTRASIAALVDPRHESIETSFERLGTDVMAVRGALVLLLEPGDTIRSDLVEQLALVQGHSDHDAIIADETGPRDDPDAVEDSGSGRVPFLKPSFDPDLLRCQPAYGRMVALRPHLLVQAHSEVGATGAVDGSTSLMLVWSALLHACETSALVAHLPMVLLHTARSGPPDAAVRGAVLVKRHLARISPEGADATVVLPKERQHPLRIRWEPPGLEATVSVVIPTRDRADLLRRCIDALLEDGRNRKLEIVIVDNGSVEPSTRELLQHLEQTLAVRTVASPGPFNFSRLVNRGINAATGELVILVNNDVVCEAPGTIDELVAQASRIEVGIVGALLTYEDDSVQHAGIVAGINGFVDHGLRGWPADHLGPQAQLRSVRRVAAVTGACMAFRKAVLVELGGFDEEELPVEFSDVDLCLRVWQSGLDVIWTPHARLRHVEGATRTHRWTEADGAAEIEQRAVFRERWAEVIASDPAYHPWLSTAEPTHLLAVPVADRPVVRYGWGTMTPTGRSWPPRASETPR
jgi:O-antigen biosynthesis protein